MDSQNTPPPAVEFHNLFLIVNLGALMLKALFESWPSAKSPEPEKGKIIWGRGFNSMRVSFLIVTVPDALAPNMETLSALCGGDEMKAELWEEFGKALNLPEERLEKISAEEGDNLEKCKQCVMNVRCAKSHFDAPPPICMHGSIRS
jgi:hypothetical protein